MAETFFMYAANFSEAAHIITDFILNTERPDIGKLNIYFFSIAFLYRHCLEVGLKAIGFQYIQNDDGRKEFVKNTRHNLYEILQVVKSNSNRPEEVKWYVKDKTDAGDNDGKNRLFLPMCYLYRKCVELSLKTIWFEEIGENFQTKCKLML